MHIEKKIRKKKFVIKTVEFALGCRGPECVLAHSKKQLKRKATFECAQALLQLVWDIVELY